MAHRKSEIGSTGSWDIFDLNLPPVAAGEEPQPHPEPDYETQMEHALWLLEQQGPEFWEMRERRRNLEPFRL